MKEYEVIRPWHGVSKGDVVKLKKLHPSLESHVRPVAGQAADLEVATPKAGTGAKKEPPKDAQKGDKE
ncbi:hypothetical protein PAEH1_02675 [Paenalcaligenes hominis]|uniref:Glycoprotein n=1 Tax=Paenalcaligenes hominis TaxID=643674 RepID=A0A1U9JYD1_9BURK|nr:hypothetical protein [Paenalcaligenes hominis]AQS50729.1 hypothetical protein PAEH1_02675 [Paenalcaligenes hominis]